MTTDQKHTATSATYAPELLFKELGDARQTVIQLRFACKQLQFSHHYFLAAYTLELARINLVTSTREKAHHLNCTMLGDWEKIELELKEGAWVVPEKEKEVIDMFQERNLVTINKLSQLLADVPCVHGFDQECLTKALAQLYTVDIIFTDRLNELSGIKPSVLCQ